MVPSGGLNFDAVPRFNVFRDLIRQNIGYFPEFSCDRVGLSGHRVRAFFDPPGAEIRFSERALSRYIRITDILFAALTQKNSDLIADCLCAEAGGELLASNRFQGLALIAHGFRRTLITRLPMRDILNDVIRRSQIEEEFPSIISLLLPLGHEIGHLPQAQALLPQVVRGDEFLETFRINYNRVIGFTGEFDYASSFAVKNSPINLVTLRQEVAADYFATCALSTMFAMKTKGQQYPLEALVAGLLIFPMAMAFEAMSCGRGRSLRDIQETTLAMQCRNSLLVDGVRACIKSFFKSHANKEEIFGIIDCGIDHIYGELYSLQKLIWAGMRTYGEFANKVASWNNDQVLAYSFEATPDVRQQIQVGHYIRVLFDELDAYPLLEENEAYLRAYSNALLTFDTIVQEQDGVRFIR